MKTLIPFLLLAFIACKKPQPAPAPVPTPTPTPSQPTPPSHYITFTDNGSTATYSASGGLMPALRKYYSDNLASWLSVGMSFRPSSNFTHHQYFSVAIPIDSSKMNLLQLNYAYGLNDTVTNLRIDYTPGTIRYELTTAAGTDKSEQTGNGTAYFNKIKTLTYIGNRRYDPIEKLTLCDYEITGNFTIRVKNDVSGTMRDLTAGDYKMKVSVLAK